jgi:hypothetical protein
MRLAPLSIVLALVACAAPDDGARWAEVAAQADEGGTWMASETALLVVPGNLSPRDTPAHTARDAAMTAWVPFAPNDCVTATTSGPTVTYVLDDCMGSFGLVQATGTLAVTYLEPTVPGRLEFHASTTDLVLNGGHVSFEADATVVHDIEMLLRTVTVSITTDGTGPAGSAFTRTGTQTARWFDSWGCLLVDSSTDALVVDGTSWQATTTGLTYCIGECPMADGLIQWSGVSGTLEIAYGGEATGAWSVQGQPNRTGSLPLSCGR